MKMPPERDFGFYQRRKHDKWCEVPAPSPALEGPIADSHAHVHTLPDPSWELVRCAANNVRFVCEVCDPSEDKLDVPSDVRRWCNEASASAIDIPAPCTLAGVDLADEAALDKAAPGETAPGEAALGVLPVLRITAGVHPHNASLYCKEVEKRLLAWLSAPETVVLGEIGLDYHYDISPRDAQREVFRHQLQLAKELDLPVSLHLRSGEDPHADNAHREAFEILSEVGFPARGTILHCCTLAPDELMPWIESDCHVAYGGALTFASADDARAGACLVPENRLLLETDTPYMTPVPMRGAPCTPAHVVFTAAKLAELRGYEPGAARERFLQQLWENTQRFFVCE